MPELFSLQLLLATFGGWINRHQAEAIDYLVEENRVLKEQLGGKRLRLTNDQRRRLAAKGKILGHRLLGRIATIVTPDTIMRWHRKLIAAKWTYPSNRIGRPGIMKTIRELIVRMATGNASWGYCRIQGELRKLNHRVAPSTIAKTLKEHGIKPAPERPTSWRTFLKSHADVIAGIDFFTVEVWTTRGLVTHYVLFLVHHATRAVHIAGITPNPNSAFMARVVRNLTAIDPDFMRGIHYLIHDGDKCFTAQFKTILKEAGIDPVQICYQAPNMNAIAERWVLSVKSECLNRMIFFGVNSLWRAVDDYCTHFHQDRPHQGLGNELITPTSAFKYNGKIIECERLGGLLRSYQRAA